MINFSEKNLIVLGAGSSAEYGFPTGKQLIEDIINLYESPAFSDYPNLILYLVTFLRKNKVVLNQFLESDKYVQIFLEKLKQAAPESIDDFIEANPDYSQIAKLFTALCISSYEFEEIDFFTQKKMTTSSELKDKNHRYGNLLKRPNRMLSGNDRQLGISESKTGWYQFLGKELYNEVFVTRGDKSLIDSIASITKNLTVITFNYDRSLERFLFLRFKQFWGLENEEIKNIFPKIIHPYGNIGNFLDDVDSYRPLCPTGMWRDSERSSISNAIRDFLKNNKEDNRASFPERWPKISEIKKILDIASLIKSPREGSISLESIDCKKMYFLGFGYIPTNLKTLFGGIKLENLGAIYGTTYGLSPSEISKVIANIKAFFSLEHFIQIQLDTAVDQKIERYLRFSSC